MTYWRIRKEDDGDYFEVWTSSDPETDAPDNTVSGNAGEFEYKLQGSGPTQVIEAPDEIDGDSEMLGTVDNRNIEEAI